MLLVVDFHDLLGDDGLQRLVFISMKVYLKWRGDTYIVSVGKGGEGELRHGDGYGVTI